MFNNSEKERVAVHSSRRHMLRRVGVGLISIFRSAVKAVIALLYVVALALLWQNRNRFLDVSDAGALAPMLYDLNELALVLGMIMATVLLLLAFGTPRGATRARNAFIKAGFQNSAGEVPVLLERRKDKKSPRLTRWVFDPCGIPLHVWEAKVEELQSALDITIDRIVWGNNRRRIIVYAVPAQRDLPKVILWENRLLSEETFELVLGESYACPVRVNLAKVPHLLIGGSTGSGKSVLLKLLIKQALQKGAAVFIADFKHGVDYPRSWRETCGMCFEESSTVQLLSKLVGELDWRKELLLTSGCPNIDEYNKSANSPMRRIIFACDEVAELLDKTGRSKEQKEMIDEITGKLATIARQGRACGIHLILATQRPDAQVLPGQIKNNIDCRICGKADNVLSQIILDSTDAATVIPKDSQGRFLMHDGTVFQAYWLDESQL